MISRKDYIDHFLENLGFSKNLIFSQTFSFGLATLLIGIFVENNLLILNLSVFLILFLFYLFIIMYKNSGKKVKNY